MATLAHFEIHADDLERAKKFYTNVFCINADKWGGVGDYWLLKGEALNVKATILKRQSKKDGIYNTFMVDNLDETLQKVKKFGGSVLLKKTEIESLGFIAYVKDTEGNTFGLVEQNKSLN